MNIDEKIKTAVIQAVKTLYNTEVHPEKVQLQNTRKDVAGDFTVVVFPFVQISRKSPEVTANEIGNFLKQYVEEIADCQTLKGFLNITLHNRYWIDVINDALNISDYGFAQQRTHRRIVIEYSSPNTNKPLHLGHIRNNLLGLSAGRLLKACGYDVVMVNLVNDRGIHICKSMLAYQKWGNGEQPSVQLKGDHLVGKYYVMFDKAYKAEIESLVQQGITKEEAEKKAPIMSEAQEMLRRWEAGDQQVVSLWKTMNRWVYDGFDVTYRLLGVSFDKMYYESDTYLLGKDLVRSGVDSNVLYTEADSSIWCDLTADGLDKKLLLRSDGTSVYMTQDLGTAHQRYQEYQFDKHIYVVGNEQDYHFKVLSLVLGKLGFSWAKDLYHLSYGMVELPEGKMKSREGTVVDADDLIAEMIQTARDISQELGKLDEYSDTEKEQVFSQIALGALKYFILKVDPHKKMLFDPRESIDFNGNTGPFIQYTHARIQSVLRKAADMNIHINQQADRNSNVQPKEQELIKLLRRFPEVVAEAGSRYSPALIANYVYEVAKEYNQFYQEHPILRETDAQIRNTRLCICTLTGRVIKSALYLLGIEAPERM